MDRIRNVRKVGLEPLFSARAAHPVILVLSLEYIFNVYGMCIMEALNSKFRDWLTVNTGQKSTEHVTFHMWNIWSLHTASILQPVIYSVILLFLNLRNPAKYTHTNPKDGIFTKDQQVLFILPLCTKSLFLFIFSSNNFKFKSILECKCDAEFVDTNGYGNCKKADEPGSEFEDRGTGCYVREPSNCTDLQTFGNMQYSWEACRLREGKWMQIDKLVFMKTKLTLKTVLCNFFYFFFRKL